MSEVLDRPAEPPDAVLRYADRADGVIDLFVPAGSGGHPVVVLLHGGFWRKRWDRRHVRPMAHALADSGCVVAAPEYRRGAVSWPAMRADVQAVASELPGMLAELGVQTSRTTWAGHSAGGHLALWLATESPASPVERVVGLAPVADLRYALDHHLGQDAARDMLGPLVSDSEVTEADPAQRLEARPAADIVVLHGTADTNVPVESSRRLVRRHRWITYVELPDADHFELIDPVSRVWPQVLHALTDSSCE